MYYPLDTHMAPEQRDLLAAGAMLWTVYEPLLSEQEELAGGMQWRTVDGIEYLSRYRPDPDGRSRKLTKSLGRRSPETEQIQADFLAKRKRLASDVEALDVRIGMIARAARGMGIARLSRTDAERLHRLRRAKLIAGPEPVLVPLGSAALVAYEAMHGTLANASVVRGEKADHMTLYVRSGREADIALGERVARALFSAKAVVSIDQLGPGRVIVFTHDQRGERYREVELLSATALDAAMACKDLVRSVRRTVFDGIERLAPVSAIVPAADGSIQGYRVPDPRGYAMALRLSVGDLDKDEDLDAFKRASFVAWSIRNGVIRPGFEEAHEDAMAAFGYPNPLLGYDPTFEPNRSLPRDDEAEDMEGFTMRGP